VPRNILNVPVFDNPPATEQALTGYQFDPEKRGTAYFVVTVKGVEGLIKTNKHSATWGLNAMGPANQSGTSQPPMRKVPCTCRPRELCTAPVIGFTPYKFWLEESGFLASAADDQPTAAPATPPEPAPEADPPGADDQQRPSASANDPPEASPPPGSTPPPPQNPPPNPPD